MDTIKENIIKFSGSAAIDGTLEHNTEYAIGIKAQITDGGKDPQDNGESDQLWKAKVIQAQISTPLGPIRTKEKSKQSQKLRLAIIRSKPTDSPLDDEANYQSRMGAIRHYLPEILDLIDKLDKDDI